MDAAQDFAVPAPVQQPAASVQELPVPAAVQQMDSNVPLSRILSRAQQSCAQEEGEGASTSGCVQQLGVDDTPQSNGEMPCAESNNPDMSFADMLSEAQEASERTSQVEDHGSQAPDDSDNDMSLPDIVGSPARS